MSEKNASKWLRETAFRSPHRYDRIENVVGTGIPDVNVKVVGGCEAWIEIKSPTEPKRSTTPLLGTGGRNHNVSQEQKNWFLKQRKAGGVAMFFIATDKRRMLIPGQYADQLNEMTVDELMDVASWASLIGEPVDPKEILQCFKSR